MMRRKNETSLSELSDEELMRRYTIGEIDAFNEIHRRHAPKIYGYLRKKLKIQTVIDDVFQDTFLRLHRFRSRYDPSVPFLPWLFTITRNALIDNQRKRQVVMEHESQDSMENFSYVTVATEPSAPIQTFLGGLSDREKEILTLHLEDGFSFKEIGAWLRISPSNARKLSSRAIQKLRSMWK